MNESTETVRTVAAARGVEWLAAGFDSFRKAPAEWVVIALLLLVLSGVGHFLPLAGPLLTLTMPVFLGGLMQGCREQQAGEKLRIDHLFAGFRSPRLGQLLLIGTAMLVAGLAVGIIVGITLFASLRSLDLATLSMLHLGLGSLLVLLLALGFVVLVSMAVWFAPALVMFKDMAALDAMKLSFDGCVRNTVPFLLYGLVALVITVVAMLPFMLGFLVAIPVFMASAYFGYHDIFE